VSLIQAQEQNVNVQQDTQVYFSLGASCAQQVAYIGIETTAVIARVRFCSGHVFLPNASVRFGSLMV